MNQKTRIEYLTSTKTDMKRDLGLFSAVNVMLGIMIGSGIFYIGSYVVQRSGMAPGFAMSVWFIAGLFSLMAALCYAELAAAMPRSGGEYLYITEAYGKPIGFLVGWTMFWVSFSGSIAAIAIGFFTFLGYFYNFSPMEIKVGAAAVIILLSFINVLGIKFGGIIQNIFTIGKLLPILLLIVVGFIMGQAHNPMTMDPTLDPTNKNGLFASFSVALIAALWAYDGWNNVAVIAEEIKEPQKNIPRAVVIAVGGVTIIYCLFNLALFHVLPLAQNASHHPRPGIVAAQLLMGGFGATIVAIGFCVSTFGSCNGCVMSFPRAYYAMAKDKIFFNSFSKLHEKYKTPYIAIIASCVVSVGLVFLNSLSELADMVVFVAWTFYTMTIVAIFIFRKKYPDMHRPYKVWFYPYLPILTIVFALIILGTTLYSDPMTALKGWIVPIIGIPFYFLFTYLNNKDGNQEESSKS